MPAFLIILFMRRIIFIIAIISCGFCASYAQTPVLNSFSRFVEMNYKLPDSLKSNCEWMYAIVKVKTNSHNKIIHYDFLNEPSNAMKRSFQYLIGYQFPVAFKINNRPVVFYFSVDNLKICDEKPGDKVYYAPNQVAQIITSYVYKVMKEEPKAIIIPGLIIKEYFPTQR